MPDNLPAQEQRRRSTPDSPTQRLLYGIGLAAAVGITYFLAAQLSLGLLLKPDGVAVFWPAAGISSGVLIALGPSARWPVAIGAIVATVAANLMGDRDIWASLAFALCNAAEALITAGLIQHYFGDDFSLARLRDVLGLLVAAVLGTGISGLGGALAYKLFHSPTASMFMTWRHWFASDAVGIIAVAPLVIGLAAAVREPPPRSELGEGVIALLGLAAMTGIIISLPPQPWQTVVPAALLFPMLLWLTARCRPVFAAAGAFLVSLGIVWTTIFGIGHFGDRTLPIDDRILQAQAVILVVTLGAFVLAALFSERRDSETRLARSNALLERERSNRLMNLEAMAASIGHEVRQPLSTIAMSGEAMLRSLARGPPDLEEVRSTLDVMISESHRASEVFDSLTALFSRTNETHESIDLNELALGVMQVLGGELKQRGIASRFKLASELPRVIGHRGQLQEVIVNLVHNAIEAMDSVDDSRRMLDVKTERRGADAVVIAIEDSGPGIEANQLENIFTAFVTTKPHGTGLGLAICRMIIERHAGQLIASSDGKSGALFQIVLPIDPMAKGTASRA